MAVDVSIIIVNFKTKKLVRECIDSIKRHTADISYEIIVVDNASEDISSLQSEGVRIIPLDKNVGFGGANNIGADKAEGNVLFFLNPDTILLNNALKILYETLRGNAACGVCGANVYNGELKPHHSYFYCTMTLKHVFRSMVIPAKKLHNIKKQHNFEGAVKSVDYITGADLMISKNLFNKIGGFNRDIFMYYEDVDLCSKVRKMHKKCYSVPHAKIQHFEGQSFNTTEQNIIEVSRRKKRMSGDSIAIFLKNNYGYFHYNAIIWANVFINRIKLLSCRLISKKSDGVERQLEFFKYIKSRL